MLKITIPEQEFWDEEKEKFVRTKSVTLQLEHSLVSLSKWEAKWHKPFLGNGIISQVSDYIADSMTATWFSKEDKSPPGHEIVTAEIIYYWMIALNIPFECQKWHLNRLLTLIRVCNAKNAPSKPLNKKQLAKRNAALNAARRKAFHSNG